MWPLFALLALLRFRVKTSWVICLPPWLSSDFAHAGGWNGHLDLFAEDVEKQHHSALAVGQLVDGLYAHEWPVGHHHLFAGLKLAKYDLRRLALGLHGGNEIVIDFRGNLTKGDQTAHTQGGADGSPALRFQPGAQADEQIARKQRFLNNLQSAPAQFFRADER